MNKSYILIHIFACWQQNYETYMRLTEGNTLRMCSGISASIHVNCIGKL